MAAVRLDGPIELRVILGHSVQNDHELTEEATEDADNWLVLCPTISLSDFVREDLVDGSDRRDERIFNVLLELSDLCGSALSLPSVLFTLLQRDLVCRSLFLSLAIRFNAISIGLDLQSVRFLGICQVVADQRPGILVMRVHLSDKRAGRVEQPGHDVLLEHILLETITEHACIAQESKRINFHILRELLGKDAADNFLMCNFFGFTSASLKTFLSYERLEAFLFSIFKLCNLLELIAIHLCKALLLAFHLSELLFLQDLHSGNLKRFATEN